MTCDEFEKMTWAFQDSWDSRRWRLLEMSRDQVRDALQWCLKNQDDSNPIGSYRVGGYTLNEWTLAFTVRLLDPACE